MNQENNKGGEVPSPDLSSSVHNFLYSLTKIKFHHHLDILVTVYKKIDLSLHHEVRYVTYKH